MRNAFVGKQESEPITADSLLKVTSLLYFEDALKRQQYEDCPGLTQAAQGFGVLQNEINKLIAGHLRELKTGRQNEANQLTGGRRF